MKTTTTLWYSDMEDVPGLRHVFQNLVNTSLLKITQTAKHFMVVEGEAFIVEALYNQQ